VLDNPHLNEVIVVPRVGGIRGLAADVALGRRLRAGRFDLAIDFHGGPRASLLTWLSRAPERIGYEIAGRSWMYTRRVARPRALRPRHSVENQWDLLRPLDIDPPDRERDSVDMAIGADAIATVARRLAEAGVAEHHRLIVIHVSAGNPFRRWPLEHFVALTTALAGKEERRIIVTSGPSDREAAVSVVAGARAALGPEAVMRVLSCGEFSLAELRALFDRATLYIGGDSGPLHIAATSRVAIVALYGPTVPARSAPWRSPAVSTASVDAGDLPCRPCDQRTCQPGDFRCLTWIPPERVVAAALRLMNGATSPHDLHV
jgi:ADP-heptose:LPS heptosyltransferase